MNHSSNKPDRILAIAPSTRGFGFAVLEGDALIDWGVKSVKGDKNAESLKRVNELIECYLPAVLVLPNISNQSRRSERIRELSQKIIVMSKTHEVRVVTRSRKQVSEALSADRALTKHEIAEILAKRFPDELGARLPPKRQPWMSEDSRMDTFGAVAMGVTFFTSIEPQPVLAMA